MKVEKQGYQECMLATLSALAEVSLAEVRRISCMAAGVSAWHQTIGRWHKYDAGVTAVIFAFPHLEPIYAACVGNPPLPTGVNTLPATGRGAVVVGGASIYNASMPMRHIMPFENGMVIDPNHPDAPCTLDDWLARMPGWVVVAIRTID